MKETNDFIGNYRILTKLPSDVAGELYFVEHTFRTTETSFHLLWPGIELSGNKDRAAFLQKIAGGTIHQNSSHIPILDAGIDNQHPYIIIPHSTQAEEIIQEHLRSLEAALQEANRIYPDDPSARTEAFLRLFTGLTTQEEDRANAATSPLGAEEEDEATAPTVPLKAPEEEETVIAPPTQQNPVSSPAPVAPPPPLRTQESAPSSPPVVLTRRQRVVAGYQRLKLWQRIVLALLALALISWGSFAIYTHVPALGATVTITPVTKALEGNYPILVSTGNPTTKNFVQGRKLSITSPQRSQTVTATGKGHHDATAATGDLVISQIHLDDPTHNLIGPSTLTSSSGVTITTEGDVTVSEGGTTKQHAHADKAGGGGNIPAYDINDSVEITSVATKAHTGTAYVTNPNAFTGGADASDFVFVQQSDIDNVIANFSKQSNTSDMTTKVTQQIEPGEVTVDTVQCKPNVSSNHKANDQANDVTINYSTTCAILVYKEQSMQQVAMDAYQDDGSARFGEGYSVVGNVKFGLLTLNNSTVDSAQVMLAVKGIWSFQWTPQRQEELQNLIAGKPQADAVQILGGREGVKDVNISGNWFPGNALPSNPNDIKFVVTKVNGLP